MHTMLSEIPDFTRRIAPYASLQASFLPRIMHLVTSQEGQ